MDVSLCAFVLSPMYPTLSWCMQAHTCSFPCVTCYRRPCSFAPHPSDVGRYKMSFWGERDNDSPIITRGQLWFWQVLSQ